MEKGVERILAGVSIKTSEPNFIDTPARVAKMFKEMILPQHEIQEELNKIFSKAFPSKYRGMVLISDIISHSMCPHHLLPVEYNSTIAYIPRESDEFLKSKVIGLSKVIRVAQLLAKQAILQEDYTQEIADVFQMELLPKGVAVIVKGIHNCIRCRGVKSLSPVVTSVLIGAFMEDAKTREELFSLLSFSKR